MGTGAGALKGRWIYDFRGMAVHDRALQHVGRIAGALDLTTAVLAAPESGAGDIVITEEIRAEIVKAQFHLGHAATLLHRRGC